MNTASVVTAPVPIVATLLTGLLIAFAVQLLLTSLGAAAGITALGWSIGGSTATDSPESEPAKADTSIIGMAVGLGTLVTVNTVLFIACFLAVRLSLVSDASLGAILGVVIWSGYFLLVAWIGSSAVGSLLGSIASTVTAGAQGLIASISTVFQRREAALPEPLRQQIAAAEALLQDLRAEGGRDRTSLQDSIHDTVHDAVQNTVQATLQDYLATLQPPKPDLATVRQEFADALNQLDSSQPEQSIDRAALLKRVSERVSRRTDLSPQDVHHIVSELESVGREVLGGAGATAALTRFLSSASPQELTADTLKPHLAPVVSAGSPSESPLGTIERLGIDPKQLFRQLVRTVRQRVDLSDLDVGQVVQQLQALLGFQTEPVSSVQADVEDFLLNAYPWQLTAKTIATEFKPVIFDREANPIVLRQQLEALCPDDFATVLHQREDLSEAQIGKLVDRLEAVRQETLESLEVPEVPSELGFLPQIREYLHSAETDLKPIPLKRQMLTLLQQGGATIEAWPEQLQSLDRDTIRQALQSPSRDPEELEAAIAQVETVRDRLVLAAKTPLHQHETAARALWQQLEAFVRNPEQKLTARTIQRQFKTLLKQSEDFPVPLPFDRPAVEQWLVDRQNLSAKRIQQIVDRLEAAWNDLADPVSLTPVAEGRDRVQQILLDFLQNLDSSRLQPEALAQDLFAHLRKHGVGLGELGLLVATGWGTIVQPLQQRHLSTEQVRQVQQAIASLAKLPRRWVTRSSKASLGDSLLEYLRQADLDDLDPAQLQQRLSHWLQTAANGRSHLERSHQPALPDLDLSALTQSLSDRGDLSADKVATIAHQVKTVFQQTIEQGQALQQQSQQAIASVLDKLTQSLSAVEFSPVNLDPLKQLQELLSEPHTGWETLKARLASLNRETIDPLLQTRADLSESVKGQILDRLEAVRSGISQQVNQLQQEAEQRLEALKQQAQERVAATQKAIAIAAWWLFSTALSSAATAAIAGALAADGLDWLPW